MQKLMLKSELSRLKTNPLTELVLSLFEKIKLSNLKKEFRTLKIKIESKEREAKVEVEEEEESKKLIFKKGRIILRKESKRKKLTRVYQINSFIDPNLFQERGYINELKTENLTPELKLEKVSFPSIWASFQTSLKFNNSLEKELRMSWTTPTVEIRPLMTTQTVEEIPEENTSYEEKFDPLSSLHTEENLYLIPSFVKRLQDYVKEVDTIPQAYENLEKGRIIDSPKEINGQKIYQRVIIENPLPLASVYDALIASGIPIEARYDSKFGCHYVSSVYGIPENPEKGIYWEFYINGEIAKTNVDEAIVRKGDIIEFRLGTTVCGCSGSFQSVKPYVKGLKKYEYMKTPFYIA